MACSGLHCGGCGAGSVAPVVALTAFLGAGWVAEHLIEVAVVSAACGVLAVAAVVALMRWADRRDARLAARGPLMVTREPSTHALTATVIPQVTQQGTRPPAIENHYHVHYHAADGQQAPAITEGK